MGCEPGRSSGSYGAAVSLQFCGQLSVREFVSTEQSTGKSKKTWSLWLGALLVVLGILAISLPFTATMAVAFMTGWLLLFAGIEQVVYAMRLHDEGGLFTKILLAGVYIIAGGMLLRRPTAGMLGVAAIFATVFIVDGILEIALAIRLRGTVAIHWLLIGGILSLVFGALIWRGFPNTSFFLIGTFLGVRLIFKGIEHIRLAGHKPDIDQESSWTRRAA